MGQIRQRLIDVTVMVAIGLVLALIGPFGSFAAPFAWRLVYWVGVAVAGYALYRPIARHAAGWAEKAAVPEAAMWVVACLIASVPMTGIIWAIRQMSGQVGVPTLEQAVALYGYVLVIGGAVCALFYLLGRRSESEPVADAQMTPTPPPARLFDRLPPHLRGDLVALEMEDHYVRVHCRAGSALVLLRMRDAVAELDGIAGAQVHRSWWVARDAVAGAKRDGRNVRLLLANGGEAPVARGTVGDLRAEGWF